MDWQGCKAVERDPDKHSGDLIFVHTRVPVEALFENLSAGDTVEEFLESFAGVERWQVEDVLRYTAEKIREEDGLAHPAGPGWFKGI